MIGGFGEGTFAIFRLDNRGWFIFSLGGNFEYIT